MKSIKVEIQDCHWPEDDADVPHDIRPLAGALYYISHTDSFARLLDWIDEWSGDHLVLRKAFYLIWSLQKYLSTVPISQFRIVSRYATDPASPKYLLLAAAKAIANHSVPSDEIPARVDMLINVIETLARLRFDSVFEEIRCLAVQELEIELAKARRLVASPRTCGDFQFILPDQIVAEVCNELLRIEPNNQIIDSLVQRLMGSVFPFEIPPRPVYKKMVKIETGNAVWTPEVPRLFVSIHWEIDYRNQLIRLLAVKPSPLSLALATENSNRQRLQYQTDYSL